MFAPILKRNTLEQTGFRLEDGAVIYSGKTYLQSDILELRSYRSIRQTTHNVVGPTVQHDPAIAIFITMRNGEVLSVVEQSTVLYTSKRGRVDGLQDAYDQLCQNTLDTRVARYMTMLLQEGFFQYAGWKFIPGQGRIEKLDSSTSMLAADTSFMRSYGYLELVPKAEGLGGKIFRKVKAEAGLKAITIDTLTDSDIFFALMKRYFKVSWNT